MTKPRIYAAVLTFAFVCPMATAQVQVRNFEAEGNLAPTHEVGCIPVGEATAELSPADIAQGVLACFQTGRDQMAGNLMVLMLARGRFDVDRVTDKTAHQAAQVLSLNLANAGGAQWPKRMGAVFQRLQAEQSAEFAALCTEFAAMGPPQHSPRYMIQHGMGAFLEQDEPALIEAFDPEASWHGVLYGYLKCPEGG